MLATAVLEEAAGWEAPAALEELAGWGALEELEELVVPSAFYYRICH